MPDSPSERPLLLYAAGLLLLLQAAFAAVVAWQLLAGYLGPAAG